MEHHHIGVQLKQLLKRGYSINDAKKLLKAPLDITEKAMHEVMADNNSEQKALLSQRNQARYAMRL
ncbi:hypothetical protein [Neptunomonas japonica]|uniref:Uncharacterized protein n=1 Tax=Neptunomonas japonica JAMM 1380 TaxID=1441457 RepID=A0A7R6P6X2_9GAMM|nr:hypothetical protein [Neptunomonas japonica]BBB28369.1 conserved hypothetical protein [Neptunomonas japonica JAMM 1380]